MRQRRRCWEITLSLQQVGQQRQRPRMADGNPTLAETPLLIPSPTVALDLPAAMRTGMGPSPPQPSTVAPYTQPGVTTVNHPSAAGNFEYEWANRIRFRV